MKADDLLPIISEHKDAFHMLLNGLIRSQEGCCPIEYVCQVQTGQLLHYREAATLLSMGEDDIQLVVGAADNYCGKQKRDFRARLLAALEMPERETKVQFEYNGESHTASGCVVGGENSVYIYRDRDNELVGFMEVKETTRRAVEMWLDADENNAKER